MPRIVVLDGFTLVPGMPGDPDWSAFEALGSVVVHDRTAPGDVVARARGAEAVITNKTPMNTDAIAQLATGEAPLRYIGVLATGVNVVDLAAARAHGVAVTNVPGYSTASVAQHVFALLLELVNRAGEHDAAVRSGAWTNCPDFAFTLAPLRELEGLTLGIVGVGAIGKRVARIGAALGMSIAAAHQSSMARVSVPGVDIRWMPVDDLFRAADVITLHCPLTDATRGLVSAERLAVMKPTAHLINTGRGPLVDEPALAAALAEGRLAGAGLDVLSAEPPRADNPLLSAPHCVITPHNAWASVEARRRLMAIAADNLRAFLAGRPVNAVA